MPASTRAPSKGTLACGSRYRTWTGRAVTPRNLAPRDLGVRLRQQSLKTVVRHKSTAGSNPDLSASRRSARPPRRYPTRHTEITRPLLAPASLAASWRRFRLARLTARLCSVHLMDRRRLWSSHDAERNRLVGVAPQPFYLEVAKPGVDRVAQRGRWLRRTMKAEHALVEVFRQRSAIYMVAGRTVKRRNGMTLVAVERR